MFKRILVAIDDSDSNEVTLSFVLALARQSSATVRVVHINEFLVGGRGTTMETQAEAIQRLEIAVAALRDGGIPTEGSLYLASVFGVDARIVNAAHDWSADVIVLGSRRQRFFRFGGKGMRERVTRLTALPILTAPAPLKLTTGHFPELPDVSSRPQRADFPSISI
jgi:nucleotide-binding universal stress UspA family protein